MSTDNARTLIVQAQELLTQALGELDEAPPPSPLITTVDEFDTAYAAASSGDVLRLASSLRYDKPLMLDKAITLQGDSTAHGRVARDEPLPLFTNGLDVLGHNIGLWSLGVHHTDPATDIVVIVGEHVTLDRVRVLGDQVNGAKRGIAANGAQMIIAGCLVDNCFRPTTETQAICSWDMGGGLVIDDCYLAGAGQSILFGGGDAPIEDRMPHDISITQCHLTKNPAWYHTGQPKTALEFKAAQHVVVDGCRLEYAGIAQGQGGYLILATVRNQDGRAPWSAIEDVTIANCTGGHASGVCSFLGSDDVHPSGTLDGFTLRDCAFEDIDPTNITQGAGRLFFFDRAPHRVTVRNVRVSGGHLSALGYFCGPAPTALVLEQLAHLPPSEYGWKIDGGGMGRDALLAYAPDATLDDTIV